jgi:hypothetical protein
MDWVLRRGNTPRSWIMPDPSGGSACRRAVPRRGPRGSRGSAPSRKRDRDRPTVPPCECLARGRGRGAKRRTSPFAGSATQTTLANRAPWRAVRVPARFPGACCQGPRIAFEGLTPGSGRAGAFPAPKPPRPEDGTRTTRCYLCAEWQQAGQWETGSVLLAGLLRDRGVLTARSLEHDGPGGNKPARECFLPSPVTYEHTPTSRRLQQPEQ